MTDNLIQPHGGVLVDLIVDESRAAELKAGSKDWSSWDLTARQLCDIELLMNGGFSPLTGFLNREDYEAVCDGMRLTDGTLWPIPITLDVTELAAVELQQAAEALPALDWRVFDSGCVPHHGKEQHVVPCAGRLAHPPIYAALR